MHLFLWPIGEPGARNFYGNLSIRITVFAGTLVPGRSGSLYFRHLQFWLGITTQGVRRLR
jgi:hypothetical protein